jgi:hypothetical protein
VSDLSAIQVLSFSISKENIQVKLLKIDGTEGNYALEKECKQQHLKIKFEYSGPCTLQRNGKVERKFQKLYG